MGDQRPETLPTPPAPQNGWKWIREPKPDAQFLKFIEALDDDMLVRQELEAAVRSCRNLDGINLEGRKLANIDLRCARLRNAKMRRIDLSGANMSGADVRAADMKGCNLTGAQCQLAHFPLVNFRGAKFKEAQLAGAWLRFAFLEGANFFMTNLASASLVAAHLSSLDEDIERDDGSIRSKGAATDLTKAIVTRADFRDADLSGCSIAGAAFTRFTPPRRKPAFTKPPAWRIMGMAATKQMMASGYRALAASVADGDDSDEGCSEEGSDDGDDSGGDGNGVEGEARITPDSVLDAELQDFSGSAASMLQLLDEQFEVLLRTHLDPHMAKDGEAIISGALLLKFKHQSGGIASADNLRDSVLKALAPLFDKHLTELLDDVSAKTGGERKFLLQSLKIYLTSFVRNSVDEQIASNAQRVASILNSANGKHTIARLAAAAGNTWREGLTRNQPGSSAKVAPAAEPGEGSQHSPPATSKDKKWRLLKAMMSSRDGLSQVTKDLKAANDAAFELLRIVRKQLETGLPKQVKAATLTSVQRLTTKLGHTKLTLARQAKKLDFVESEMKARLGESARGLMKRYVSGGLRASLVTSAMHRATKYEVSVDGVQGSLDMLGLAYRSTRSELIRHANELRYLDDELAKLKGIPITKDTWHDAGKSWGAVLTLITKLDVEVGQTVLECICADDRVLIAIGVAEQLNKCKGSAPPGVTMLFNDGPSEHIRYNGYRYHRLLMRELARVERVMEVQSRMVGLIGTFLLASLVGGFNVVGQLYHDLITADPDTARNILLAAIGAIALCIVLSICMRRYCCRRI